MMESEVLSSVSPIWLVPMFLLILCTAQLDKSEFQKPELCAVKRASVLRCLDSPCLFWLSILVGWWWLVSNVAVVDYCSGPFLDGDSITGCPTKAEKMRVPIWREAM